MTMKQKLILKSLLVNSNNWSNKLQLAFNRLNKEISPGFNLIDNFSSCFSFYLANRMDLSSLCIHFHNLDILVWNMLFKHDSVIAIVNASIKDNITIFVSHIYTCGRELSKKIHHVVMSSQLKQSYLLLDILLINLTMLLMSTKSLLL